MYYYYLKDGAEVRIQDLMVEYTYMFKFNKTLCAHTLCAPISHLTNTETVINYKD